MKTPMKTPFQRTNEILDALKNNFEGFDEENLKAVHPIVLALEEAYETVFRAYISAVKNGEAPETPKVPRPKRVSGYTVFGNSFRAANKDTVASTEMFTVISGKWKALSKVEKDKWNADAVEVNKKEEAEYIKTYGALPTGKQRLQKGPKPCSPFTEFSKEFRSKASGTESVTLKQIGAAWKAVSAEDRKVYVARAAATKAKNVEEFAALKKNHPELIDDGRSGKKKKVMVDRPKTKTGYILFGNKWRETVNKGALTGKAAVTEIANAWKKLSEAKQAEYNAQANKGNVSIVEQFVKANPTAAWTLKNAQKSAAAPAEPTPAPVVVAAPVVAAPAAAAATKTPKKRGAAAQAVAASS